MGRHESDIDDDKDGRAVAEFLRWLKDVSDLTYRQIGEVSFVSHTFLSQNADGRLTKKDGPIRAWIEALYLAVQHYDIAMPMTHDKALDQALRFWQACHDHQRKLRQERKQRLQHLTPTAVDTRPQTAPTKRAVQPKGNPKPPGAHTSRPAPHRVPAPPNGAGPDLAGTAGCISEAGPNNARSCGL